MQPQQESVEDGVFSAGAGGSVDLGEFARGEGTAGVGQATRLGDSVGGTGGRGDKAIGDGPVVDCSGGGDDMSAGVPAVAGYEGILVVFNASNQSTNQIISAQAGRSYSLHPVQATGADPIVRTATLRPLRPLPRRVYGAASYRGRLRHPVRSGVVQ